MQSKLPIMEMELSRRDFLTGALTLSVLGTGALVADDRLPRFLELSARLTGFQEIELNPDIAHGILAGLDSLGHRVELDRILGGHEPAPGSELPHVIAVSWYSGVHPSADGPVVGTFRQALVWQALGQNPPGNCVAGPGSWGVAPVGNLHGLGNA